METEGTGTNEGENMVRVPQVDDCICRWEIGPVQREEPEHEELMIGAEIRALELGRIQYYREAKHYINFECPQHKYLLRASMQRMVEAFKKEYPQLMQFARTMSGADTEGDRGDGGVENDDRPAYFEFTHFRLRVPIEEVKSGIVRLTPSRGVGGLPAALSVAYQFFDPTDARNWAQDQAAWLVWKHYGDDPWKEEKIEGNGAWITVWDDQDKYFWPADDPEGEQHCSRCHHVCSRFCKGMADELSVDHTARGECSQHWIGCPGC